jgi:hypothetical protein
MGDDFEENFTKHLDLITKHFCYPTEFGPKKNPKAKAAKKKKGTAGLIIQDTEQETVDHVILGTVHEVEAVLATSDSNNTAGTQEAGHTNGTPVEIVPQCPLDKTTAKKKTKKNETAKENETPKIQELLLSISKLDQQANMFKVTMESNAKTIMDAPFDVNPLTRLWKVIDASALLRHKLSEYFKVTEIAVVMVLGSVEDGVVAHYGPWVLHVTMHGVRAFFN